MIPASSSFPLSVRLSVSGPVCPTVSPNMMRKKEKMSADQQEDAK